MLAHLHLFFYYEFNFALCHTRLKTRQECMLKSRAFKQKKIFCSECKKSTVYFCFCSVELNLFRGNGMVGCEWELLTRTLHSTTYSRWSLYNFTEFIYLILFWYPPCSFFLSPFIHKLIKESETLCSTSWEKGGQLFYSFPYMLCAVCPSSSSFPEEEGFGSEVLLTSLLSTYICMYIKASSFCFALLY